VKNAFTEIEAPFRKFIKLYLRTKQTSHLSSELGTRSISKVDRHSTSAEKTLEIYQYTLQRRQGKSCLYISLTFFGSIM
jgi:hypothetical protein